MCLLKSFDCASAKLLNVIFGEAMQKLSIEELGSKIFFL